MERIAIIGGTGLIGTSVGASLASRGFNLVKVARHVDKNALSESGIVWKAADVGRTSRADWAVLLEGVAAVVNCAGALQDGPSDDIDGTHRAGLSDLIAGCQTAGVKRFIHFSAMGVDRATPTPFSATKRAGDEVLSDSDLDWVILRPSVVLGASAYGASALIRGLSSLPILPVMPDTGALRPVALEDVVATVEHFLRKEARARVAVELAGPDRFEFSELVGLYRRWLGFSPAVEFALPRCFASIAYGLGDMAGRLGWRPPVRGTAKTEIALELSATLWSGSALPASSPGGSCRRSKRAPPPCRIGGSRPSIS